MPAETGSVAPPAPVAPKAPEQPKPNEKIKPPAERQVEEVDRIWNRVVQNNGGQMDRMTAEDRGKKIAEDPASGELYTLYVLGGEFSFIDDAHKFGEPADSNGRPMWVNVT